MPLAKAYVPHNRKRQLCEVEPETEALPQLTEERQTPSSFWDSRPGSGSPAALSENSIEGQSGLPSQYRIVGLARKSSILQSLNALRGTADQILVAFEV